MLHRRAAVAAVLALSLGGLTGPALATPSSWSSESAPGPAVRGPGVRILNGNTPETSVFPNDRFTVPDSQEVSGERVNLPIPRCTSANYSECDALRLLNGLDGFDLQPVVTIPFSGNIDINSVSPSTVYVVGPGVRSGLVRVVLDPATHILQGTVETQLLEDTTYTIVVTRGVRDTHGHPIVAGTRICFTTETATLELDHIRRSLDSGLAYRQAGITPTQRGLNFTQGSLTTVFPGPLVLKEGITRNDQVYADPAKPKQSSVVPDLVDPGSVGYYAFGSYLSPQFVTSDAYIPQVPTKATPPARSAARLGFAMIVPVGTPPAGGWPVAVYGPGFTRSYFDLYVTADHNAALGIATLATDPLGHGYGPLSTITVDHAPTPGAPAVQTTFLSYGRGRALDGSGIITSDEGVQPTDHKVFKNGKMIADYPSHEELIGLRDGLIQTTADNMALVRAIERGVNVPTPLGPVPLARTNVEYYGLSFGGIYGTMLMGTDPDVRVGYLNSGGGPILDIARLSGFRSLLARAIQISKPDLLNGGPGLNGFTESIPGLTQPPITDPYPGSAPIRQFLAYGTWLERSGSPEAFAPLIRLRPRYGAKTVEFSNAFGDHTVPNVTAGNIFRAGHLFDRVTYYRNDKTPTNDSDPHGFLADPTLFGREFAEEQLGVFLATRGTVVIDPDGPGPIFEVPVSDPGNFNCLHYAEPETGQSVFPPPPSGTCGPVRY
ncbi:MAG: Ig-like domain-containing domain [Mycobacteriales bacterium]